MSDIEFAIIGGGWRAEFFLRIAAAMPERFACSGLLVRDAAKGRRLEQQFGVATYRDLDALLSAAKPLFTVVSVPWAVSPVMLGELASRRMPALAETPPAPDVTGLTMLDGLVRAGAKIQVAEQYPFQPLHAARLAVARSGHLGPISQAQVSACHGYHGASLLRRFLGVRFEEAVVSAFKFTSPITASPDRNGPPREDRTVDSPQLIAHLDFGDRLGVYDFADDQYFSYIRSNRVLVRGPRGEIHDSTVRYLKDFRTPVELDLRRIDAGYSGNLEGLFHKGYLAGDEWVYRNPFAPARLTDDEIAIATSLEGMARYVGGGPDVYSLAEAAQDRWLGLCIVRAIETGAKVRADRQPWAR